MKLRLTTIYLDRHTKMGIKEIPIGWKRILRIFGYKKVYLSERREK